MAIAISSRYPWYWELDGKTVLLLGGSKEDNLFQVPDLEEHLRLLASAGGNYIRCTMSSRDPGDIWPFERGSDGVYDLNVPSKEYWRRVTTCLRLCRELNIVAQIEVWDRFDFSREPWRDNGFNPKNNCNYTSAESGLDEEYPEHPGKNLQPFFFSVPPLNNNALLLKYQHAFVDELMRRTLPFDNVLYCIDNETNGAEQWGAYWSRYIQNAARAAGKSVYTTEMWDDWDITSAMHARTIEHRELYQFLDLSQNNQTEGSPHWDHLQKVRARIASAPRPINNVKIYGAPAKLHKDEIHAQQSFWRAVFGGVAAARFHRPPSGLGLNEIAQAHIRSMRMVEGCFPDWFVAQPRNDLIGNPTGNHAYCRAAPGVAAVVCFDSHPVVLDISTIGGAVRVRWLDILHSAWSPETLCSGRSITLTPPGEAFEVAVVTKG